MDRTQKEKVVAELGQIFENSGVVVVAHYEGFTVAEMMAYGEDPVATAKAVQAFVKENDKLDVIGGSLGGQVIDREGVAAVSKMPSREETISTIVGMLGAPASGLAGAVAAPAANIAGALGAPGGAIAGIVQTKAAA